MQRDYRVAKAESPRASIRTLAIPARTDPVQQTIGRVHALTVATKIERGQSISASDAKCLASLATGKGAPVWAKRAYDRLLNHLARGG